MRWILGILFLATTAIAQSQALLALSAGEGETAVWQPAWYGQTDTAGGIVASNVSTIPITDDGWIFDGVNDYIKCNRPPSLEIGTGRYYSLSAWVKLDYIPAGTYYFFVLGASRSAPLTRWGIWIRNTTINHAFVSFSGGALISATSPSILTYESNRWYHIAMTLDRESHIRFWRDGVLAGEGSTVGTTVADLGNSLNYGDPNIDFAIGAYADGNYKLPGQIKSARVWNGRELSAEEIESLYERTHP